MHFLTLPIVCFVIRGGWGHTVEVLTTPCQTLTIHADDASNVDPTKPSQPSASTVPYEPWTETFSPVNPIGTTETISSSEHVQTTSTEPRTSCTESAEDTPVQYHEPVTYTAGPTIRDSSTPCPEAKPSNHDVSEAHPSIPVPISEPAPSQMSTKPVHTQDQPIQESEYVQPPAKTELMVPPEVTETTHWTAPSQPGVQSPPALSEIPTEPVAEPTVKLVETTASVIAPTQDVPPNDYHGPISTAGSPSGNPITTQGPSTAHNEPTAIPDPAEPPPSTLTSLGATPTEEIIKLNLEDATLGPYARFIDLDGQKAILLEPPPDSTSNFTLKVQRPYTFRSESLVYLKAFVKVDEVCPTSRRRIFLRQDKRAAKLSEYDNDNEILKRDTSDTRDKFEEIDSDKFLLNDTTELWVKLEAGSNPVALTFSNASLALSPPRERRRNIQAEIYRKDTIGSGEDTPVQAEDIGKDCPIPGDESELPTDANGEGSFPTVDGTTVPPAVSTSPPDVITGIQTTDVPTPTPGPVEVPPNVAGHGFTMNVFAVYGIPFVAALLL
jgi:hypothetical protein